MYGRTALYYGTNPLNFESFTFCCPLPLTLASSPIVFLASSYPTTTLSWSWSTSCRLQTNVRSSEGCEVRTGGAAETPEQSIAQIQLLVERRTSRTFFVRRSQASARSAALIDRCIDSRLDLS